LKVDGCVAGSKFRGWTGALFLFSLFTLNFQPGVHAAVVINEFLSDPSGSDTGREWVELYNDGGAAVDLAGWTLQRDVNGPWTDTVTGRAATLTGTVPAKGFFLIEDSEAATVETADVLIGTTSLGLGNASTKAEGFRLLDAAGVEQDRVVYGGVDEDRIGAEGGTGQEAPSAGGDVALARLVDGRDTGSNFRDFVADDSPTPAEANDAAGDVRLDHAGTISYPNPFVPAVHPFVTLSIPERVLGPLKEVRVYDVSGEPVCTLAQSRWDGRNEHGDPVAAGLYYYVVVTSAGKARGKVTLIR
jgi:hypothetical protein